MNAETHDSMQVFENAGREAPNTARIED